MDAIASSVKAMYNYYALEQFFSFMRFFMVMLICGYPVFRITNHIIDSEKLPGNTDHKRDENSAKERVDESNGK